MFCRSSSSIQHTCVRRRRGRAGERGEGGRSLSITERVARPFPHSPTLPSLLPPLPPPLSLPPPLRPTHKYIPRLLTPHEMPHRRPLHLRRLPYPLPCALLPLPLLPLLLWPMDRFRGRKRKSCKGFFSLYSLLFLADYFILFFFLNFFSLFPLNLTAIHSNSPHKFILSLLPLSSLFLFPPSVKR